MPQIDMSGCDCCIGSSNSSSSQSTVGGCCGFTLGGFPESVIATVIDSDRGDWIGASAELPFDSVISGDGWIGEMAPLACDNPGTPTGAQPSVSLYCSEVDGWSVANDGYQTLVSVSCDPFTGLVLVDMDHYGCADGGTWILVEITLPNAANARASLPNRMLLPMLGRGRR